MTPTLASRRMPDAPRSRLPYVIAILVLVAFATWHTWLGWNDPYVENSDQVNIGIMVLKLSSPELFARDYAFSDARLFSFYTPGFLSLIRFLNGITRSYDVSLVVLVPVIMLTYLGGMFALVAYLTKNAWVAAFVAVVSSPRQWTAGSTFWGVTGLGAVMPRTLFTMLVPWLVLLVFTWAKDEERWKFPLVALITGLSANLHPVSAFHFMQVLLSIVFVTRPPRKAVSAALASGLAACVGALPMIITFISGTRVVQGDRGDFHEFLGVLHERFGTLFPFPGLQVSGVSIGQTAQEAIVWIYLGAIVLWAAFSMARVRGSGVSRRQTGGVLLSAFVVIQLPVVYLLLGLHRGPLVLVTLLYGLCLGMLTEPGWEDRMVACLLGFITAYAFAVPYFLGMIWRHLEWWVITPIVAEQSRMAQLIPFALYLAMARLVWLILHQGLSRRIAILATVGVLLLGAVPVRRDILPTPASWASRARTADRIARQELYDWARSNTPTDALFYYDSLEFRYRAQRSITHAWKDLGLAYYSQRRAVAFYRRFKSFEQGYGNPSLLLARAQEAGADYVVLEARRDLRLGLPIVFDNGRFTVYQYSPGPASSGAGQRRGTS